MIEPLKHFTFKGKAVSFLFAWIDDFFESKKVPFDPLILYQINGPKTTFTEQALNDITILYYCPIL